MAKNTRLLAIDDDVRILKAYRDILSPGPKPDVLSQGAALFGGTGKAPGGNGTARYDLTLAKNGETGVRHVRTAVQRNRPFAAAFIDMKMPGIDGAETARRIWKADPEMKLVIVTAYSEYLPEDISRVTGRSDFFFLRKPFNPEEIRQFAKVFVSLWNKERNKGKNRGAGRPAPRVQTGGGVNHGPPNVPAVSAARSQPTASEGDPAESGADSAHEEASHHVFTECPFCNHGIGLRIPRKKWMRLIPYSKYYYCNWCFHAFMKIEK